MDAPAQHVHQSNPASLHPHVAGKRPSNPWLAESQRREPLDIAKAKAYVALKDVVEETHVIKGAGKNQKVLCPAHDDHDPSCHIYEDHWHCYACGTGGDVITWLEFVGKLTKAEAVAELRSRAGGTAVPAAPTVQRSPKPSTKAVLRPIAGETLAAHLNRAEKLVRGPKALAGRGFTLNDLRYLGVAADGEDAIIPITGPNGDVMALKRRFAVPRGNMRYTYDTPGHGSPAWCSLGIAVREEVLIKEGELNAMVSWLACPHLGLMGIAGTNGDIYAEVLKGKIVYVYADGDKVGLEARTRWANDAIRAGAKKVYLLEPWEMDACDIAGKLGREELARRLS